MPARKTTTTTVTTTAKGKRNSGKTIINVPLVKTINQQKQRNRKKQTRNAFKRPNAAAKYKSYVNAALELKSGEASEIALMRNICMPGEQDPVHFVDGFSSDPATLATPLMRLSPQWSTANGEPYMGYLFKNPGCTYISLYANSAALNYKYFFYGCGQNSATDLIPTSPGVSWAMFVQANEAAWLNTPYTRPSTDSQFKPHGDYQLSWVGHRGDTGGNYVWIETGSVINFAITNKTGSTADVSVQLWYSYEGKEEFIEEFAAANVLNNTTANVGATPLTTTSGYYAFAFKGSVDGNYTFSNSYYSGSGPVYGHMCMSGYCENATNLPSVRTIGTSIRFCNTASFTNNQGSIVARQMEPGKMWYDYKDPDELANMNKTYDEPIKRGYFGYVRCVRKIDLDYQDIMEVENGDFRGPKQCLKDMGPFIAFIISIEDPTNRSGFIEIKGSYEALTQNNWFNPSKPRGEPVDAQRAVQLCQDVDNHVENPTHILKILNATRNIVRKAGKTGLNLLPAAEMVGNGVGMAFGNPLAGTMITGASKGFLKQMSRA